MKRHFAEAVTPKSESSTARPRCRWQVATSFLEAAAWDREGNKFCSPGYQPLDTPWFGTTSAKSLVPLASPLHLFHLKYPCKNTPREDVGRCCAKHSLAPRMAFSRSPAHREPQLVPSWKKFVAPLLTHVPRNPSGLTCWASFHASASMFFHRSCCWSKELPRIVSRC